ncbi:fibronectin type III domain-containing protein [Actinoplanes aureus]|uniref:Fibronectin type III domain-containing protein n=1 Tax=Actinoplanes aureus TaxID=2792083 RepID=A0A931C795_9ACTN|nr:fibronectin type III domain-containing protein [Actinoplanes aureus]MBG0561371.1 fibronectin type III domain-containing protein [Actinoplanes aureus]
MSPSLRRRGAVLLITAVAAVAGTAVPASAAPSGPATPVTLWASTLGTGISLTWEQPRSGSPATSFRVYENDSVVARVSTTAAHLEVPFGSSHTYTVAAVDHRGRESARTAPASGRSWLYGYNPECMPVSGVPITVTEVTATAISVSWSRHSLGGDLELRVDGQSLGWTSSTGARVGGLAPGTDHHVVLYRLNRCHTGGGGVVPVASTTVTTAAGGATPPQAPSGLTVTGRTDSTIGLAWTAPPGPRPARYAVYDGATLVAVTSTTTVTVDRLHHATWHRFTVAALDAAGNESAHSAAATAGTETCLSEPPRPVALTATAVSSSSVRLSWTLEAAATSYTVFDRGVAVATTRYPQVVLTGLPPASEHAYRVVATLAQGCGESPRSRRAEITTPGGPAARPAAPATLAVTGNVPGSWPSGAQLTLTWSASAGGEQPAGYRVYEGAAVVGETGGTSLTLPVGAATTHEYVVVAVDAAGNESAPSPRVTVQAMYMPPP